MKFLISNSFSTDNRKTMAKQTAPEIYEKIRYIFINAQKEIIEVLEKANFPKGNFSDKTSDNSFASIVAQQQAPTRRSSREIRPLRREASPASHPPRAAAAS